MSDLRLALSLHQIDCPHCQKQTRHSWPGSTILFSTTKCEHCGTDFLIVQNKPWLDDSGANSQPL